MVVVNILDTFKNHKSVQRINVANFYSKSTISFSKVTESEATKNGDIPAKTLKR